MPNTQTSVPAFTSGQVLTAAQMTEVNTGIPVFATTTTRDAAFGGTGEKTLAEGQFAYIEASDALQYYNGTSWLTMAGKIAQIVTATKTDTFTTTSTTFVDVTGLSATITPTSTSNTILVLGTIYGANAVGVSSGAVRVVRGSTAIFIGDAAGSRTRALQIEVGANNWISPAVCMYIDSPATTSATTYKWQAATLQSNTFYVNRSVNDTDASYAVRTASSITVLEISA